MAAIKQYCPWVIRLTLRRRIMCQREVYCPVNPMLFPWVVAVRQRGCWHSIQMQLLSMGRDGGESGFQMFLGASAVGETPPFCLRRCLSGGAQMFTRGADTSVIITFPFRENSFRTIAFFFFHSVCSFEWVCVCVCFFFKGTLVWCAKRIDVFGVSVGCQDPFPQPRFLPVSAGCCW